MQEGAGWYLDLHDLYNQYINSKFGERVEYSVYLDVFSQPEKISRKLKFSRLTFHLNFFLPRKPLYLFLPVSEWPSLSSYNMSF